MSAATAWFFNGTTIVKPIPVTFGGLEAAAIEIMEGPFAGVYVHMAEHRSFYSRRSDVYESFPSNAIGELQCERCMDRFRFMQDGRVWTFPRVDGLGWTFWNPSPLATPGKDPQVITVRALCRRCSEKREQFVENLFRQGHP